MCKASALLAAAVTALWAGQVAMAGETTVLRVGDAKGPGAIFAVDKAAKQPAIVVRTSQAGVAGSRFEIRIDGASEPVFTHIFMAGECKFGDDGSRCEAVVPQSSPEFPAILRGFRRGRLARVSVQDAGVMRMDQTVSLAGVAKAFRGVRAPGRKALLTPGSRAHWPNASPHENIAANVCGYGSASQGRSG